MPNDDIYSAIVCLETQVDLITRTLLCMMDKNSELGQLLSLIEDNSSLKVRNKSSVKSELMETKRKFFELQHAQNTITEKRRHSYQREADPLRDQAISYQSEADAWRLEGSLIQAAEAESKAREALLAYLEKKKEIRERYPDAEGEPT